MLHVNNNPVFRPLCTQDLKSVSKVEFTYLHNNNGAANVQVLRDK